MALADVEATDIDAFYEHMALRWGRTSLHRSATVVRAWLRYCETKGYARLGLADAILLPRIYRDEALPMGPTWDTVGRMLAATSGDDPVSIRSHAIILLLAVYGLRSGEVRHLRLDDVDWPHRPVHALTTATARVVPFAYACDGVRHCCSFIGVIGLSATPRACSFSPSLPPEAPSLGRHYPASTVLRASPPPCPARPCPHGSSVGACHATGRASRVASTPPFHTCRRHYPGGAGRCLHRSLPDPWQPSPSIRRVGFRITCFEACTAFITLRPAWALSRPRRPVASECFRRCRYLHHPLRLLPAGATVAGRDSHPLRTGALRGALIDIKLSTSSG